MRITSRPKRAIGRHIDEASFAPSSPPRRLARVIHQNAIPATKVPATSQAEVMTWEYSHTRTGLATTLRKPATPSSSARPVSGLKRAPTGCCIQEFAPKIHSAENIVPKETSQMQARCHPLERRPHPKIHRPRKVDSRKKARRASTASGAPKISPT